jgi:hypothetical protein
LDSTARLESDIQMAMGFDVVDNGHFVGAHVVWFILAI